MSLGYAMTHDELVDYAIRKNIPAKFGKQIGSVNDNNLILLAIDDIKFQVPGGAFLRWKKVDCIYGRIPFFAIAFKPSPKYATWGTPERMQALKSAMEKDVDPEWIEVL